MNLVENWKQLCCDENANYSHQQKSSLHQTFSVKSTSAHSAHVHQVASNIIKQTTTTKPKLVSKCSISCPKKNKIRSKQVNQRKRRKKNLIPNVLLGWFFPAIWFLLTSQPRALIVFFMILLFFFFFVRFNRFVRLFYSRKKFRVHSIITRSFQLYLYLHIAYGRTSYSCLFSELHLFSSKYSIAMVF